MKIKKRLLLTLSSLVCFTCVEAQPFKTEFSQGEITVESLKRTTDETVLIKGTIKNTSSENYSWYGSKLTGNFHVFNVRLQDLKSKRQFEQITVDDKAVGSAHEGTLKAGQSATFWARLTAPPKDTGEVSIIFGGDVMPIDKATISE
jgi:hypothetical protein